MGAGLLNNLGVQEDNHKGGGDLRSKTAPQPQTSYILDFGDEKGRRDGQDQRPRDRRAVIAKTLHATEVLNERGDCEKVAGQNGDPEQPQ